MKNLIRKILRFLTNSVPLHSIIQGCKQLSVVCLTPIHKRKITKQNNRENFNGEKLRLQRAGQKYIFVFNFV